MQKNIEVKQKCRNVFRLAPQFHQANRSAIQKNVENGGNTAVNFQLAEVGPGEITTGAYNSIQMPRGVVDWHSHPSKCKNQNMCALGLPSPADMANIAVGTLAGTQVHLVYASEGTYVIRVREDVVALLQQNPDLQHGYLLRIRTILEGLHEYFLRSRISYKAYASDWMDAAKYLGFDVQLFKKNEAPVFPLFYDCKLGQSSSPLYLPVETNQSATLSKEEEHRLREVVPCDFTPLSARSGPRPGARMNAKTTRARSSIQKKAKVVTRRQKEETKRKDNKKEKKKKKKKRL